MNSQDLPLPPRTNKPSVVKRLGLGAFSISLLVHGLFALIAVLFLYKWVYPPEVEDNRGTLIPPGGGGGGSHGAKVIQTKVQHQKAMAPTSMPKIISIGISDFTLPDTSSQVMDSALPMNMSSVGSSGAGVGNGGGKGPGNGLGSGPGDGLGMGPGIGKGFMTPFGSSTAGAGSMPGRFYDFKQMPDGKPTEGYSISNSEDFTSRVNKIQDSGYRETAFRKFFQAPDTLYLTQLAIPVTDANAGPKFFNVEGKVKPSGWFVHYEGAVRCDRDITFRFVGIGDDYLAVYSNNRPRVIAPWPQTRTQVIGRWDPSEPIADRSAPSPLPGGPMGKGDWVRLKKGELLDLDIGLGESPGGKVGFVLMIEEKDAPYRTASNGEKILPLFTTEPITKTARDRITKDFPNWEFEWDGVPVFAVDKASGMGADLR